MRQKTGFKIFVHVTSIIIVLITLFPVYVMIMSSFKPGREVFEFAIVPNFKTLTLGGYASLFTDKGFFRSFSNTFMTSAAITVFALLFAAMSGFALAKLEFPFKKGIFLFMISTMMVPFSLLMLPLFLIVKQFGFINTMWSIIIPGLPRAYGVFLIRQFMKGIPNDLIESAKIDGCTYTGIFTRIILPMSKPILFTLATTIFLTSWNNYTWPLIALPEKELRLLQVYVSGFFMEHTTRWDLIFASLCLSTIPTIILFFVAQKFLVEGIKLSGIKE